MTCRLVGLPSIARPGLAHAHRGKEVASWTIGYTFCSLSSTTSGTCLRRGSLAVVWSMACTRVSLVISGPRSPTRSTSGSRRPTAGACGVESMPVAPIQEGRASGCLTAVNPSHTRRPSPPSPGRAGSGWPFAESLWLRSGGAVRRCHRLDEHRVHAPRRGDRVPAGSVSLDPYNSVDKSLLRRQAAASRNGGILSLSQESLCQGRARRGRFWYGNGNGGRKTCDRDNRQQRMGGYRVERGVTPVGDQRP